MRNILFFCFIFLAGIPAYAQNKGMVNGFVKNKNTQETLPYVPVKFMGKDTLVTVTDSTGYFKITLPVGTYQLASRSVGYAEKHLYNINVGSGNAMELEIELLPRVQELEGVVINYNNSVRATDMVTPLSTQRLTSVEIKENPGGNFDVSRVISVLPGVSGGTTPNRNDILVRGGGPSENVYYLDGIEIPVLNHFQTQGASGGATGILNVSFIKSVQLTSSAFDAKYDNALSSTIVIKDRNGNPNHLGGNIRLSGSEIAATLEGPLGKKTTFIASVRRSYLKYLFQLLDLPIRPDYWDSQFKIHHKFNKKTQLTILGIGALDHFKLAVPKNANAENAYIIRANPLIKQWTYTVGASLKHLINNGYYTIALSRDVFYNGNTRYENNATESGKKLFTLKSHQKENQLRLNVNKYVNGWKYSYGLDAQYVKYDADIFNTVKQEIKDDSGNIISPAVTFSSRSAIDFFKFGAYAEAAKYFFNNKFLVSGGVRADMNSYTKEGLNPLKTLSPRLSFSYSINSEWNVSASVGSYFKIPVYTMLGYENNSGTLVNKNLKYINAIHYTIGTEFIPRNNLRFTFNAFYKDYNDYPVSLNTGISFANIGTDYEAVGNDHYASIGKGRTYGVEAYVQQKLVKHLYYVASATLYKSEFSGIKGIYRPSTWDYGFLFSATMGYKFNKNWTIGAKYRLAGGQPYTPFDIPASTQNYLTTGQGVYDYSQLNSERLPIFRQLDLRVDKKFNFKKTSLDLYLDFQNVLFHKTAYIPRFTFKRNANNSGFETTNGEPVKTDGSNAIPYILNQRSATIVPSIGFIFKF